MSIFKKFGQVNQAGKLKRIMNWYGPYLGAGVKLEHIAEDWREVRVAMHMRWYNRNAVGTHFGGSLYAMIDPHYMLMLMKLLGRDYVVWDKAAHIDFIRPGKGTVRSTMRISDEQLNEIIDRTQHGDKYLPEFIAEVHDEAGQLVARSVKTLYVKRKTQSSPG
jgi:acyl-coenzyme A thioesterase PaaI-like protein